MAANRKPSAAAAQPASPSPTPSEIATAEPVKDTPPIVQELMSSGPRVVDEQEGYTVLEVNP